MHIQKGNLKVNDFKILSYLSMAEATAKLSPDEQTKVGCILVRDGVIISSGYNGFLRGADDNVLPKTRPEKYEFMFHAERNSIFNCARIGTSLSGAEAYCTLSPCIDCTRSLFQCGVNKIYFKDEHSSFTKTLNAKDFKVELGWTNNYSYIRRL